MPDIAQTKDLTRQYVSYDRSIDTFRPVTGVLYTPGLCVKLAALDLQVYPDQSTVALPGVAANPQLIMGVVAEVWPGFAGSIGAASYLAPNQTLARGSQGVDLVILGYHPAVFIDQSGVGAVTVTNEVPVIPSRATSGYVQGVATAVGALGSVGVAMLPAAGIGSSLTAAALAQAAQTSTVAGVPAVGDTLSVTIQAPYASGAPGVVQTTTFTTAGLTAAQAASVTSAAAALVTFLNAQAAYSQYFTATSALGVVTHTVNALSNPFAIIYGTGTTIASQFNLGVSGSFANALTFAAAATGGSTHTAGGATFAGGTGYKGTVPVYVL
ncbi:MAG: hypothetical protein NVS1B2_15840 [Vulcanimicrobiaceae bacterium]